MSHKKKTWEMSTHADCPENLWKSVSRRLANEVENPIHILIFTRQDLIKKFFHEHTCEIDDRHRLLPFSRFCVICVFPSFLARKIDRWFICWCTVNIVQISKITFRWPKKCSMSVGSLLVNTYAFESGQFQKRKKWNIFSMIHKWMSWDHDLLTK